MGIVDHYTKRRPDAPPGLFAAEAAGLAWLRVPGGAPVADVIEVSETSITLERVVTAPASSSAAAQFGTALARTHDAGAAAFGAAPDGFTGQSYIADLPMSTEPTPAWGRFFAEQRLMPYARLAAHELGSTGMRIIESLCTRLSDGIYDDDAPPARLHGDLWSGNVLFTRSGAVMIDPSAHGGHRVSDLAMLSLFGAPYLNRIFEAYENASTHLPPDWLGLIGLHQVYPLLVHTVLFGGGYGRRVVAAAKPYL